MFEPLPPIDGFLQQYRVQARRQIRRNLVGGHVTRRMGQSLEFREYAHYVPGEDIRHVDWRATFRTHGNRALHQPDKWLLRRYESEERLQLLVSLDVRTTMYYPQSRDNRGTTDYTFSKLQMARWLSAALGIIALEERDAVLLHRLFGDAQPPAEVRGRGQIETMLDTLNQDEPTERFNGTQLEQFLPPTAVWLILTDFYLVELDALIERVQAVPNWVIFVELDSWPAERAALETGARLIDGPLSTQKRVNVTPERLDDVEARIASQRQTVLKNCPRADYTPWTWPTQTQSSPRDFFLAQFAEDNTLQRLFMKDS